jgi:hypothetical protein
VAPRDNITKSNFPSELEAGGTSLEMRVAGFLCFGVGRGIATARDPHTSNLPHTLHSLAPPASSLLSYLIMRDKNQPGNAFSVICRGSRLRDRERERNRRQAGGELKSREMAAKITFQFLGFMHRA